MKTSLKLFTLLVTLVFILGLTGCSQQSSTPKVEKTLKVGVTAGPHAEIMDVVKKVAIKDGL